MLQTMLNPLIDEIFGLIFNGQVWQVHSLATKLKSQGAISVLDSLPERDLFKRNFLMMNALYQLQQLQISGLHIKLITKATNLHYKNLLHCEITI
ncbi:MAG: DNA-J related domain-containing protein [Pseudoalteromonas sp.]|uniref:DNA-J related domain-containing protein n=2 Tax=Pseudoalteromonas TaxID=53246 RepID=UPI003F9714A2